MHNDQHQGSMTVSEKSVLIPKPGVLCLCSDREPHAHSECRKCGRLLGNRHVDYCWVCGADASVIKGDGCVVVKEENGDTYFEGALVREMFRKAFPKVFGPPADNIERIPSSYRGASIKDFPEVTQQNVEAWTRKPGEPGEGLFLNGPTGTGKTHLACAILLELRDRYKDFRFQRCADLYRRVRDAFKGKGSEAEVFEACVKPSFLVLDDFAAGSLSEFERSFALEIFDTRKEIGRITVVTSNLGLNEIGQTFDDRLASRLSAFAQIILIGKDRRAGR